MPAGGDDDENLVERRLRHLDMADRAGRRTVACAHAGSAFDAHLPAEFADKRAV